ncbi:sugar ABC transporter substrate-binding protein [Streptomyces sp. NPDC002855]|uniref:ABC transporter substrate-binding protein n=1 Tax=Streptomyces sp. NPDC002855 TaxID=3154437 RepID=UPI00332934D9
MRRRTLLCGAMAAPLLAACSGRSDDGKESGGRTTLSYGVWDVAHVPGLQKVIDAFEKENPGISVRIELTPWSSYWTTLKTAMRGGTAPDVFWMNAVNLQLYASSGVLEPLSGHIESDATPVDRHPESLVQIYAYQGTQYGIPKDFDTIGLWYNKALFDKAGIKYPDRTWTWDDVRDAAAELTNPRERVHGMAAEMDRQAQIYPAIHGAGGYVLKDGKSGFGDERSIEGLRYWTDMIDRGWSPPQSAMVESKARNRFWSEKAAMVYEISAFSGQMHATPAIKDHGGVTVLPKGRERATIIHGLANVISAKSRKKAAAWKFVHFMAGRRAAEIQASSGVTLSSYEGTQDAWFKSMPEFDLKVFVEMQQYAVPYPSSKNTAVWENLQYPLLGAAFSGKGGIESAARTLGEQMDRALKEERA